MWSIICRTHPPVTEGSHMDYDLQALRAFAPQFAGGEFLRRAAKTHSATAYARREAVRRLESRLTRWDGIEPADMSIHGVPAPDWVAGSVIDVDEAEMVIVRALSDARREEAQFTVKPNGAVFSTHNFGWTKGKVRIFVAGLSPLLDQAVGSFHRITGGRGGRILFTPDATFIDADLREVFLRTSRKP